MPAAESCQLRWLPMPHASDPFFRTFHALRLKGFAKVETIGEVADLPVEVVLEHLAALELREWAMFREARELWQLTPAGREAHLMALAEDIGNARLARELRVPFDEFVALNEQFKVLCGEWQLRDGQPNGHDDRDYDDEVVQRLVALDGAAAPVVAQMGDVLVRLAPYGPRLARTCLRVVEGETNMFTGVMCGSYHDVWMELHEDLILTQSVNCVAEGSF